MAYPYNGRLGVDHAARWKYETKNDGWWLMKITVVSQNQNWQ